MALGAPTKLRLATRWWGIALAAVVLVPFLLVRARADAAPRFDVWFEGTKPSGEPVRPSTLQSAPAPSPFDAAEAAPPDVALWVRLVDGRAWLTDPSVARFAGDMASAMLGAISDDARSPRGVASLASRLGMSTPEAFDRYLGRDARFVTRGNGPTLEWALITRVAPADIDLLAQRLRAVVRAGGMFDLPEDHLAFAKRGEWLVIGRSLESELFQACAERGAIEATPNLRSSVAGEGLDATTLGSLGQGRLAVLVRGTEPLRGATAVLLDARDGRLHGGVRGRYADAPFPGATPRSLDLSVLRPFDDRCLGAQIDPIRPTVEPSDAFLVTTFPELVPSPASRMNFSERRLILLGEVDGAKAQPPLRMRCPAIAVAYEVDDPDQALDDQDRMMSALVAGVGRRFLAPARGAADGSPTANAQTHDEMPPLTIPPSKDAPRSFDTTPILRRFFGDHPLLRATSLNWQTVKNGKRAWQIYATHPEWLAAVSATLASMPEVEPDPQVVSSAGHCRGVRVAEHLRSWTGEANAFQNADVRGFTKGIELIASIAERFRTVQWSMTLPDDHALEVTIEATLAQPTSALPAEPSRR
jgi:hypothetical protein